MRESEALRLMGHDGIGWRVYFKRLRAGDWITDFFPAAGERPYSFEDTAEEKAAAFRQCCGDGYRNIRVVADAQPWGPRIVEHGPSDTAVLNRASRAFRVQCREEGISDAVVEQASSAARSMLKDMAEAIAEEDRCESGG